MWTLSSAWADTLFALFNGVLIIGAAAVLVGTIGTFIITGVREKFSNERISNNERLTAEANARALEARLQLEQFKAPRTITSEQQGRIVERMAKYPGTKFLVATLLDSEASDLVISIEDSLGRSGWKQLDWQVGMAISRVNRPKLGLSLDRGITVIVDRQSRDLLMPIAEDLVAALNAEGIEAKARTAAEISPTNPEAINIAVGSKPPLP